MFKYITLLLLCVFIVSCGSYEKVKVIKDNTVVYAFDGTLKNLSKGDKTSVYRFVMAHRTNNKSVVNPYAGGVGSFDYNNKSVNDVGEALGFISGVGGRQLVNSMYDELVKNFKKDHKGIVIVGFSRGAALSREFAHVIAERGDPLRYKKGFKAVGKAPKIKYLALFDTVYSFGLPFGKVDLTYRKSIPNNVMAAAHATAKKEKRNTFDLWSIHSKKKYLNKVTGSVKKGNYRAEKEFNGGHNDIGGAEKANLASYEPLIWILEQGQKAGVSLVLPEKSEFNTKAGFKTHGKGWGKRQIYYPAPGK